MQLCSKPRGARGIEPETFRRGGQLVSRPPTTGPLKGFPSVALATWWLRRCKSWDHPRPLCDARRATRPCTSMRRHATMSARCPSPTLSYRARPALRMRTIHRNCRSSRSHADHAACGLVRGAGCLRAVDPLHVAGHAYGCVRCTS